MSASPTSTVGAVSIAFRGELTQRDFHRVQRSLLPLWARAYVFVPACVVLFISIGVGWQKVFAQPFAALPDMLFAFLVFLASAAILHFGGRKQWQANARLHGQVNGQLTSEGLEWNTSTTKGTFPWSKLTHFSESTDLVLVFYAPRCAFYFPKTFFATEDAWHAFKELLAAHLKTKATS
jgi:hypothetical protein